MGLKLSDLVRVCEKCSGQKEAGPGRGMQLVSSGRPGIGPEILHGPCPGCNDSGSCLTQLGEVFAEFIVKIKAMGRI